MTGPAGDSRAKPGPAPVDLVGTLARAATVPGIGLTFVEGGDSGKRLSWAQLHEEAGRLGGALAAAGVEPEDRVALVYPTCAEFFVAFFGVLMAGAVPVPLYPPVRLGRLEEYHQRTAAMLSAAGARLVLADRRVRRILGESVLAASPELGCSRLDELPAGPAVERTVDPDELALVQFSSGTTVDPKPVALSHAAVMAQVVALNSFWPDTDRVRHSGFSWLPLYHDMGLVGCVFTALERPADLTLLAPERFVARPALWLQGLSRSRATISPAPNFAYGLCLERIRDEELDGVDLSHWRVALNGAEAVAPEVLRQFTKRFARWGLRAEALTPVYGLSEACLAVTFSDPARPFETARWSRRELGSSRAVGDPEGVELVSVGRPLPGFAVEIRGDDRSALPERRVGRVWARGPSLMTGYLDRPRATAEALVDGWLDTGDTGFLDAGRLFLTGRASDLIVLRGRNYRPEEIESSLDAVDGVRTGCSAAVGFLPEGGEREVLVLFVEHRAGLEPARLEALGPACEQAVLTRVGVRPAEVVVLAPGTLPRTSSGKIRRRDALARFVDGRLEPPSSVHPVALARALGRSQLALARLKLRRLRHEA